MLCRVISPKHWQTALYRSQLADVPCLGDSSTCGGLSELNGTIVIDSGYWIRTYKSRSFELATRVSLNHHLVSDLIGVVDASLVFSLVVLKDAVLLPCLDVLPVCYERDVE